MVILNSYCRKFRYYKSADLQVYELKVIQTLTLSVSGNVSENRFQDLKP